MKNIKFLLWLMTCFILATSCSDDDVPAEEPQLLLTKVAKDGITVMALKYDIDRKLSRAVYYNNGVFIGYDLIEYNAQGPHEMIRYGGDPPDLARKGVFTTDNFGRIIKLENYYNVDGFNNPQDEYELSYDPSGRLKSRYYTTADGTSLSLTEFIYDEDNNLVHSKIFVNANESNEYLGSESDFTLRDKSMYSHWSSDVVLLGLSFNGFEDYIREMFNVNIHKTTWNKDGKIIIETETVTAEHEFNAQGYLIRQVVTRHNLLNQDADVVREMTYEYTE